MSSGDLIAYLRKKQLRIKRSAQTPLKRLLNCGVQLIKHTAEFSASTWPHVNLSECVVLVVSHVLL